MPVTDGFRTFVLEQLEQVVRDLRHRAMFGGVGIYAGEDFFALIADDTLYLKVDDATRPKYQTAGLMPFRPYGPDGEEMQYYQVAADVIEDPDALRTWVADAIAVARRAQAARPPRRTRKR
jgi:DNA transformation protein and related proteins